MDKDEDDDDAHEYQSIDGEQSTSRQTKPLQYVELDLQEQTPKAKPRKKTNVKWADKGVVYTELNI